jgi:hypothetical protein
MVLEVRDYHLEIVEVRLRADEAGDVVDHEGIPAAAEAVTEGFGGGHVDALVRAIGELAPLACLEVHELLGLAPQSSLLDHGAIGPVEQIDADVELAEQGLLGAGDALEEDLHRGAALEAGELGLHVGEHADLRGRTSLPAEPVEVVEEGRDVLDGVDGRVDPQHRVAGADGKAPVHEQRDPLEIVGGVIGLEA